MKKDYYHIRFESPDCEPGWCKGFRVYGDLKTIGEVASVMMSDGDKLMDITRFYYPDDMPEDRAAIYTGVDEDGNLIEMDYN